MELLIENMLLFLQEFRCYSAISGTPIKNDPNVEFLSNWIDQMNCTRLQTQLAFISATFTALTEAIPRTRAQIELVHSADLISNIEAVTIAEPYQKSLKLLLKKNPYLNVLKQLGAYFWMKTKKLTYHP